MATKTKLIFTPPSGVQVKYSLDRTGTYIVGTDESCDITIDDTELAEKHGKLVADETNEARWFLQDLETSAISMLEDGTEHGIGRTKIDVVVTEVEEVVEDDPKETEEDEEETDDEEYEDDDEEYEEYEDDDEEEETPIFGTEDSDNQSQLEQLKKAQQLRELKSAAILIIVCGILSFAAGVAWRLAGM